MRPEDDWREGPSIFTEEEAEAGPETYAEYLEYQEPAPRPARRAGLRPSGPAAQARSQPRSPFWVRLIYLLIALAAILAGLMIYAVTANQRLESLKAQQEDLWGPKIEALENRLDELDDRLKALEDKAKPAEPSGKKN